MMIMNLIGKVEWIVRKLIIFLNDNAIRRAVRRFLYELVLAEKPCGTYPTENQNIHHP